MFPFIGQSWLACAVNCANAASVHIDVSLITPLSLSLASPLSHLSTPAFFAISSLPFSLPQRDSVRGISINVHDHLTSVFFAIVLRIKPVIIKQSFDTAMLARCWSQVSGVYTGFMQESNGADKLPDNPALRFLHESARAKGCLITAQKSLHNADVGLLVRGSTGWLWGMSPFGTGDGVGAFVARAFAPSRLLLQQQVVPSSICN